MDLPDEPVNETARTRMNPLPLRQRASFQALERHADDINGKHLRSFFADDEHRGERLRAYAEGVYLDYSKNRITDETLRLLIELAEESGFGAAP